MKATLRSRLTRWIVLSTLVSMTVFAVVAYTVLVIHEHNEAAALAPGQCDAPETDADIRAEILTAMAFAAPVGFGLSLAGAILIARRAARPLEGVMKTAAEMGADKLDQRLGVTDSDAEIAALVGTLNGLFARLEAGFGALGRFAADASHELRTPLSVIASELEVSLRRPRAAAEWESSARTSLEEVRRLGRLVEALLAMARADAAPEARAERVELRGLLTEVLAAQAPAAATRRISLPRPTEGEPVWVHGAPDALASAFTNVIANAVRYSPEGGAVRVTVAAADGRARVAVEDDGCGLTADEAVAIFAPFARGAAGRAADVRDDRAGFGLGLSIARRISERHHGSLTAGAAAGGGARFSFDLPLA